MPRPDPEIGLLDHEQLGQYRGAWGFTLFATQAANSILFACRWSDATRFAIITRFDIQLLQGSGATAAQDAAITASIARGFTASDTGGIAVTPTGNQNKLRTSMNTSLFADIRGTNAAAGLTAGTRTVDAQPFLAMPGVLLATINPTTYEATFDASTGWEYPIVLAQNEGIECNLSQAFPAAGTAAFYVTMDWSEVNGF